LREPQNDDIVARQSCEYVIGVCPQTPDVNIIIDDVITPAAAIDTTPHSGLPEEV